jgi:hypothetical protein
MIMFNKILSYVKNICFSRENNIERIDTGDNQNLIPSGSCAYIKMQNVINLAYKDYFLDKYNEKSPIEFIDLQIQDLNMPNRYLVSFKAKVENKNNFYENELYIQSKTYKCKCSVSYDYSFRTIRADLSEINVVQKTDKDIYNLNFCPMSITNLNSIKSLGLDYDAPLSFE